MGDKTPTLTESDIPAIQELFARGYTTEQVGKAYSLKRMTFLRRLKALHYEIESKRSTTRRLVRITTEGEV